MIFILPSISRGLEFWSTNHTSIYDNSESNFFQSINIWGEIFNNWPNDLLRTNVYKAHKFYPQLLLTTLQCINTTSVISKWGTFSPFPSFLSYFLVLPSNPVVLGFKSSR